MAVADIEGAASPWVVVPLAAGAHLAGWYGTVLVGHQRFEPQLFIAGSMGDSNLYFRRGYYLARCLGRQISWLDRVVQFCIAPLAVVQDALELVGLRAGLGRDVATVRAQLLARLERGATPFHEQGAELLRGTPFSAAAPRSAYHRRA
jgi:hypothetical protein